MVTRKKKVAQDSTPEPTDQDAAAEEPQAGADLEQKKAELIAKGLQQKFITEKDIAALLPVEEMSPHELDALYTSFLERGIPVLDTEGTSEPAP